MWYAYILFLATATHDLPLHTPYCPMITLFPFKDDAELMLIVLWLAINWKKVRVNPTYCHVAHG